MVWPTLPEDSPPPGGIGELLDRWRAGEPGALARLVALLYQEMRRRARQRLRSLRLDGETSTTSLVHETFIKLAQSGAVGYQDRDHFLAVASLAMRQLLLDRARRRAAGGPGHGSPPPGGDAPAAPGSGADLEASAADLLALHQALERLRAFDPRLSSIVELHFFGGLTFDEVAELLAISRRTALREWRKARCFLNRLLDPDGADGEGGPPG